MTRCRHARVHQGTRKPVYISHAAFIKIGRMSHKFLKMSYEEFMTVVVDPHVPHASYKGAKPSFSDVFDGIPPSKVSRIQEDLCDPFINCVEKARLCNGYDIRFEPEQSRSRSRRILNAGFFKNTKKSDIPLNTRSYWATLTLWIQWKGNSSDIDPFDDSGPKFEADSDLHRKNRVELTAYAAKIFDHQHRQFLFSALILCNCARLIFWDRSGAIVTEKFNYRDEPEKLCKFFYLFSCLTPTDQGFDHTATLIQEGSKDYKLMLDISKEGLEAVKKMYSKRKADKMRKLPPDYVREFFSNSLDTDWPWWRLSVPEESDELSRTRHVDVDKQWLPQRVLLVGKPLVRSSRMHGRGTRGYVAFDTKDLAFVFLKDQWRMDLPGVRKEGSTIQTLNAKGVNYVPTLVCHGDVRGADRLAQITSIHHYLDDDSPQAGPYVHYRLVEREVALPMAYFKTGHELVTILTDCLRGHKEAFEKAQIMHGDVSVGNTLCVGFEEEDEHGEKRTTLKGLLCDWELGQTVHSGDGSDAKVEQRARGMGTWQFILPRPHGTLRFMDDDKSNNHPLNDVLDKFLFWLKATYKVALFIASPPGSSTPGMIPALDEVQARMKTHVAKLQEEYTAQKTALDNHNALLQLLDESLAQQSSWPKNDKLGDQMPVHSPDIIETASGLPQSLSRKDPGSPSQKRAKSPFGDSSQEEHSSVRAKGGPLGTGRKHAEGTAHKRRRGNGKGRR
ncbi:hypothetical protein A0H81_00657 [Grifola frondosa]|uniref:Fungal-type protein kinase domain-containing protein n=1 Tax=Grifola frondosa TaxID=5627 RepID=A0A1C7MRB4_GRIFR|nr:hypothetical protein A0H81_00657 [Grifola frondosa]